jgi:hypothetical protein
MIVERTFENLRPICDVFDRASLVAPGMEGINRGSDQLVTCARSWHFNWIAVIFTRHNFDEFLHQYSFTVHSLAMVSKNTEAKRS